MKQFNLEEYLTNPSKKIVTRDGRKVKRILCTDAMGPYPIVMLIENYDGTRDDAFQYTKDGRYFINGKDDKDLFFASEKKEGWVNIYPGPITGVVYKSEEDAKHCVNDDAKVIATIKIEWEE